MSDKIAISAQAIEMEAKIEKGDADQIKDVAAQLAITPWQERRELALQIEAVSNTRRGVDPSLPMVGINLDIETNGGDILQSVYRADVVTNKNGTTYENHKDIYVNPVTEVMRKCDQDNETSRYLTRAEVQRHPNVNKFDLDAAETMGYASAIAAGGAMREVVQQKLASIVKARHSQIADLYDDNGWDNHVSHGDLEELMQQMMLGRIKE